MTKLLSILLIISIIFPLISSQTIAIEATKGEQLNQKALTLFNQGKIREAISLWEEIPRTELTAEILNNIGYAYYKRSRQYFDGRGGEYTYFNKDYKKAEEYLLASQKTAPQRWSAYLNLGDLYFSYGLLDKAQGQYETLLRIYPSYKHVEKIKTRVKLITRETVQARKDGFQFLIVEINPSLPLYVFRLYKSRGGFDRLDVLRGDEPNLLQSLTSDDIPEGNYVFPVDFNFDGYYDIAVLAFTGSGHNYGFTYWLFNRNSNKFDDIVNANEIANSEVVGSYIDYVRKKMQTSWS